MRGTRRLLRWSVIGAFVTGTVLLSGCSQINKTGANIALRFTEKHIIPPLLKMDDTEMGCAAGEAITPLMLGTAWGLKADADQILVIQYASAGLCAEQRGFEHELRYLRAAKANLIDEAQDARVLQKREAELAARRQYAGWQAFVNHYEVKRKAPIGDKCPQVQG
jgi:hypothetical protein